MSAVKEHFDMLSPTNNINHYQRGWVDVCVCVSVCVFILNIHIWVFYK